MGSEQVKVFMVRQRLQKVLAAAGLDSRRKCEQLIVEGRVRVNGEIVDRLPVFVEPEKDLITVDGRKIRFGKKVYYLLNKPKGVVCTNSDPLGRKKAIDFINCRQRIFCVGRLDIDSTGLILLTNDNELTNKLTHPGYGCPKTYVIQVRGKVIPEGIEKLKKGIWLSEGKTAPAAVKILKRGQEQTLLEITIRQGINRQIRRMLAKLELKAISIKRTKIANISVKGTGVGKFRPLTEKELGILRKITKCRV